MQTQIDHYTPQNEKPEHDEKFSSSGKYRLDIHYYSTREGCWNYSRGRVYCVSDGTLIADIKRNYSAFHHAFVVKDGIEYLIGGRSYMNQTIVNLDSGKEIEVSDKDLMKMGTAFCWARMILSPDGNTLIVDGCYWAAPYEFKFFDFTDPNKGWPELEVITRAEYDKHKDNLEEAAREYFYSDEEDPEFNEDGTITVYSTTEIYKPTGQRESDITIDELEGYGEAYDDEDNWDREVEIRYTIRREGNLLIMEDTWKSEWQQEQERKQEEYKAKDKAQKKTWLDASPLWAELERLLQEDPHLRLGSIGWCTSSQKDREEGDPNLWYFYPNIKAESGVEGRAASLKWGTLEGPIQAELWIKGKGHQTKKFDRSSEGLQKAINTVKDHLQAQKIVL